MTRSTSYSFIIVCRLDHDGKLDEASQDKKQKVAIGPPSKVLGPISRHRVADILHHMKLVSRASRPGLTVGVLRILCNRQCTAQRFHTEIHEQMCRAGCPNEPGSLITTKKQNNHT